ncbi:MAG: 6-bladed beta-propeller [Atribacterota bacterium]|nr:6-bladed beta-propeller [Atribacterota bacterium]
MINKLCYFLNIASKTKLFKKLILFTVFSFTQTYNYTANLITIDLTKLPEKGNNINISDFASEITYLPLETNKEFFIDKNAKFYLFDSIIVCCGHHQIFLFNSNDGSFIRSIGEYGRGPDGFINSRSCYLKKDEIIINAYGWQYPLIEYSINGKIQNKIKMDNYTRNIFWLKDNLYVGYYEKNSYSDSLRLQIYDNKNERIISSFYDKRKFKDTNRFTFYRTSFYRFKDDLFIKECFNDTVFRVTAEKLIPKIIFKSGRFSPPFYKKDIINLSEYYYIHSILETGNLIFFQLNYNKITYSCYFDKGKNKVQISNDKDSKINGFNNDIDGFMQFYPLTISNNNELIGFLESYKIKQWFYANTDKVNKLPSYIQNLKKIKETDNPVLMLVKLKD